MVEHLGKAIYALECFLTLQEGISEIMEGQFCVFFGLGTVDPAAIPDIEKVRPFELRVLFEAYSDVHQHLKKVQWFERVNAEGLQRIFSKIHRRGNEASEPYHSLEAQWSAKQAEKETRLLSRLDRIGGLRESLEHALSLPEPPESISLYLQHFPSRNSGSTRRHMNDMQQALRNGDVDALVQLVMTPPTLPAEGSQASYQQAIPDLLRFSMLLNSEQSSALLRTLPPSFAEKTVDDEVLPWSIAIAGRERLLTSQSDKSHGIMAPSSSHLRALHAMLDAIESSEPVEDGVRLIKDRYDATRLNYALHSAAHYGLLEICKRLLEMLDKGGRALEALLFPDLGSLTPLHLAVAAGHTLTVKYLIDSFGTVEVGYRTRSRQRIMGEALHIALRNQNDDIINHLLRGNADTSHKSARGETALHIAAQLGRADYAALLIPIMREQGVELDVRDTSRGWTPLFSACAGAHHDVVKLLLQAGLNHQATDLLGWTAREHAVFKGHLTIDVPDSFNVHGFTDGPASLPVAGIVHAIPRCREAESVIIACLGNTRKDRVVKAVDLSYCSSAHSPGQYRDVSYMLEVAAPGATCEPRQVRLPILEDTINDPFVFPVSGTAEPRLVFRIFRLRSGAAAGEEVLVAGGTALLESNVHCFGVKRQSLIREHTAAILDRETMLVAGTVTFTVLIARPFPHLQTARPVDVKRTPSSSPLLVGHRGRGMNLKTQEYLQLGENTVESLVSAGRLGASFVEFDVQITKDLEAVAYHDFSLSESGTDVPVHDLTLDQYMYASNVQSPHANPLSLLGRAGLQDPAGRQRSRSLGQHFEAGAAQIQDRMKHTVAFKMKGFNANTRGSFIQDSFATLKQILAQLPQGIGCDIEISEFPLPMPGTLFPGFIFRPR